MRSHKRLGIKKNLYNLDDEANDLDDDVHDADDMSYDHADWADFGRKHRGAARVIQLLADKVAELHTDRAAAPRKLAQQLGIPDIQEQIDELKVRLDVLKHHDDMLATQRAELQRLTNTAMKAMNAMAKEIEELRAIVRTDMEAHVSPKRTRLLGD